MATPQDDELLSIVCFPRYQHLATKFRLTLLLTAPCLSTQRSSDLRRRLSTIRKHSCKRGAARTIHEDQGPNDQHHTNKTNTSAIITFGTIIWKSRTQAEAAIKLRCDDFSKNITHCKWGISELSTPIVRIAELSSLSLAIEGF
jgi:hypothetical protein